MSAAEGAVMIGIGELKTVISRHAAQQLVTAMRKAMGQLGRAGAGVPDDPLQEIAPNVNKLNYRAWRLLAPIFNTWGFDPSEVRFYFGPTPGGAPAWTPFPDETVIDPDGEWSAPRETGLDRLELVAHEITHSVQYAQGGLFGTSIFGTYNFWARYAGEYNPDSNYVVPDSLENTALNRINILDSNYLAEGREQQYTLDQLAERVADEVAKRYGR
jgi:hypothetical protein